MISEIKIKELLALYKRQYDKFDKRIKKYENGEEIDAAYYMVKGNFGMAKMIVDDLERLLKEEKEK
jgi:hypothetical protein